MLLYIFFICIHPYISTFTPYCIFIFHSPFYHKSLIHTHILNSSILVTSLNLSIFPFYISLYSTLLYCIPLYCTILHCRVGCNESRGRCKYVILRCRYVTTNTLLLFFSHHLSSFTFISFVASITSLPL
jgi:hypothetical protein